MPHQPSSKRVAALYAQSKGAAFFPGQVTDDGWEPGQRAELPEPESEGSMMPPAKDSLGNELSDEVAKNASKNPSDWPAIFDSLRPGQKVWVAMTSVMGMSKLTDGSLQEWKVGRRSRSRKYNSQAITLLPADGSWKPTKYNAFRLWKRGEGDAAKVSASHGDMAVFLKGLRAG